MAIKSYSLDTPSAWRLLLHVQWPVLLFSDVEVPSHGMHTSP